LKRFLAILVLGMSVCATASAQTMSPIRVNCGGPKYTDSKGQIWSADTGYNTGSVTVGAATISGTADQTLFQSGRWNSDTTNPMTYTFPVPAGNYHVNLYLAETTPTMTKVGSRVFNVRMEGQLIFQNLDIFATVGATTALIKGADISSTDGQMKIEFDNIAGVPKIDAIEIIQTSTASPITINFVYPDGTPVAGSLNYHMSTGQVSLGGTSPLVNGQAVCYLYPSPSSFGLVGTFQVTMSVIDTTGHTLWQVSLSMDPASANLAAVQSSSLVVIVQKAA